MAAFDLENTLIASNVVASYSWLATRRRFGGFPQTIAWPPLVGAATVRTPSDGEQSSSTTS